jgi:Phosphotransferase enzyme family
MLRGAAEFEPVIAELARNATQHFGSAPVRIEPVRRFDGPYSTVLNVRISDATSQTGAFIKIFRPQSGTESELARVGRFLEREFRATTALHEALASQTEIGALRPIACLPEHRAIVTAEVQGQRFADLLASANPDEGRVVSAARRIARWIKAYQRIAPASGSIELAERREYIDDRLRLLENRILTPSERRSVLARVDDLAGVIGRSVPAVAIHADLTPANVLVENDGRVTVLDFTMAKTGTALHDLAHLYFHVSSFGVQKRSRAALADSVRHALLEGFDESLTPRDALFRLMMLQHAVCHVAMLAKRRVPLAGAAYRWYVRRRWKRVEKFIS